MSGRRVQVFIEEFGITRMCVGFDLNKVLASIRDELTSSMISENDTIESPAAKTVLVGVAVPE